MKGPKAWPLQRRSTTDFLMNSGNSVALLRLWQDCLQRDPLKPKLAPKSIMCSKELTRDRLG